MRSGPKAILYQSTLFRTSELAWVKVAPLSIVREIIRWGLIACGLAFFVSVASAKGSYKNLEGLLGLLAWHVGYWLQPDNRLASTGDLQESYEGRGGSGAPTTFRQWVGALSEGPDECKIEGGRYAYWFNLHRLSWASPCMLVDFYPLILVPVFLGYRWVIQQGFDLTKHASVLEEISFLQFDNSISVVGLLCVAIAILGIAATISSFGPGVQIRASGGLTDRFSMSQAHRTLFFERLAGHGYVSTDAVPPVVAAPVVAAPVVVRAPEPPPPVVVPPARPAPPVVEQTAVVETRPEN